MNWKIWLLIICVLASVLAIFPLTFIKGVEIASIEQNSTEFEQGLRTGQVITHLNGEPINTFNDYTNTINKFFPTEEKIKLTAKVSKVMDNAVEKYFSEIDKSSVDFMNKLYLSMFVSS